MKSADESSGSGRTLATVLFGDIVGSTERAVEVGDRRWRELLDEHQAAAVRAIEARGGRVVDLAGDGVFAVFAAPADAIGCARALCASARALGLEVRTGVHTGECEVHGARVSGLTVHIGARIGALAGPGEVVVSQTVRDLALGSGAGFAEHGTHRLKGVPGAWRLYRALDARQAATEDPDAGLAPLDFRMLGPLEVRAGGRAVPVSAGRQRALLALLLRDRGQTVARDRLLDELWGERPPPTAPKALQLYVSRLRRALGPARIVTRAPGYALRVEDGEVDADRFEALRERGERALDAGDARTAADALRAALALWRGPPLADLEPEPWVLAETSRLEERRLHALERRLEADLALGRHGELVGELEGLVRRHPLREGLRRQLMVALYGSGRQADALAAYAAARATLVEELGLEPGPELRALHGRILVQDPALGRPGTPPPPPASSRRQRRLATALYVDLGPGEEAEPDPERLAARLAEQQGRVERRLEEAGGRIGWRLGGAVLATFGAVPALEDHAARAARAALALRGAGTGPARMGLESGDMAVEGDEGRPVVSGAAVAAARRLGEAAAPGEIALGPRVRSQLREAFAVGRGRGGGPVLTEEAGSSPRAPAPGLARTFVGREAELGLLEAAFARVATDGRAHAVTIVGDAGVGKTTLAEAVRTRLPPGTPWHVGRCPSHGRALAYRPLAEILLAHLGIGEATPPEVVRARLGSREVLALALGLGEPAGLSPWEARDRLREAWLGFLADLTADGPAVALVEDVHWADDVLLEILAAAARDADGPLLLLSTARPELLRAGAPAGARGNTSQVWLEPLGRADVERLLTGLAGDLPVAVREAVADRAEGNPFFVEELVRWLLDEGLLVRSATGWRALPLPAEMPATDSIQAVLAARMDHLSPADREALQVAAVIGRTFWPGALAAALGGHAPSLATLVDRDFVRRMPGSTVPGEREYGFRHALTREVAYAGLGAAERARMHADVADWLEQAAGAAGDLAPAVAHHLVRALAPEGRRAWEGAGRRASALRTRAARWAARAGELAQARFELQDAAALFRQAAELAGDDATRAEHLRAAAHAHMLRFETDAFREHLERAIALAERGPAAARLYAELAIEGARPYLWRRPPARTDVEGWIACALEEAEPGSRARARALIARAYLDPRAAGGALAEALDIAETLDDLVLQGYATEVAAQAAVARGALADARTWVDRGVSLVPRLPDPDRQSGRYFMAIFVHLRLGRFVHARRLAAEHEALSARLTPHHEVHAFALTQLVEALAGRWEAARALRDRVARGAAANVDTPCQFNWRGLLVAALAAAAVGREEDARRLEREAADLAPPGAALGREPALLRLALLRGDLAAAERLLRADPGADLFDVDYPAARLDGLVAVGDRAGVEREAPAALAVGGYVEPFGLHALGIVREDERLLARAAARFEALGLEARAAAAGGS